MILPLLQAGQGSGYETLILFALIGVIFYFFIIRPQQKKQKDQKKFVEALKTGDKIVTIGGVHGIIKAVNDDTFEIEVDTGVRLTYDKSAVSLDSSKKNQK